MTQRSEPSQKMPGERFGDYLGRLLQERSCTGAHLARQLSVDAALVHQWLRNEAVPKLDSPHHEHMIRALALNATEANHLREAQISSLSYSVDKHQTRQRGRRTGERMAHPGRNVFQPRSARERTSRVIWGPPAVLLALISLLSDLPSPQPNQDNTLLLSFQGQEGAFHDFPDLLVRWKRVLQEIVQRGWRIEHLWRLDQNMQRSHLLIAGVLPLLGSGRYFPSTMKPSGTLAPTYDLLIVPQTLAILFLSTQTPWCIDAAWVTYDLEQIELLRTHFAQMRSQSTPLLHPYPAGSEKEKIWRAYAEAEALPGGRVLVQEGLSLLTHPLSWYQEGSALMAAMGLTGPALDAAVSTHRRRV